MFFGADDGARTRYLHLGKADALPAELCSHKVIVICKSTSYEVLLQNLEATPRFELGNRSFADSCLTTWLCRRNAVISISDIDYIKYGLICQALFKNYSKIFYELKKRVYLFISLPIFLSAIEIVPSLLLINSIYLSSSKYSTVTVISMPVSVFIF